MADETRVELELRDFLRVFRQRKAIIVLTTLVVVAVAVLASVLQTPEYAATSRILLRPRNNESLFDSNTGQRADPNRTAQTEIEVLKSEPVRTAVRNQLGAAPAVSAQSVRQTDVIEIRAEGTGAKRAADVANAYARSYIDFRRQQAVDDVLAAAQQLQSKIDGLQNQVDTIDTQVSDAPASQKTGVRENLSPQKAALVTQQALFKQKLDQLQVDAALKTGGAQMVAPASIPASPFSPRPVRSGLLAAAVGLFLGSGLAFLIEYLDDSLKTKEELARVAPSTPVIGLIPSIDGWRPNDAPRVVSMTDPRGPASEAYRSLRTAIQFLSLDRSIRTLQVTSPNAQEGKTTTLANLGVALAGAGLRVIMVGCDLRRPRLQEFFGLDNSVGLTSVLLGKVPLWSALRPVRGQDRLFLLAAGVLPPNPSELLTSKRTVDVLTSLQNEADIVLIDAPPVLPVTDAIVLAGRTDATLLVCLSGATSRKDAARAFELLGQVGAPIVGTVLNGIRATPGYGDGYYTAAGEQTAPTASAQPPPEPVRRL